MAITFEALLSAEMAADPEFAIEWSRLGLARTVSVALIAYRYKHQLSQGEMAKRMAVRPVRIAELELGETNPRIETLVASEHNVQIEAWGPFAEGQNGFFTNSTLIKIAESHDKTVAQVALHWLIQRGIVAIPKSVRADRMAENFDVFDFDLSEEEMQQIAALDTHQPCSSTTAIPRQ